MTTKEGRLFPPIELKVSLYMLGNMGFSGFSRDEKIQNFSAEILSELRAIASIA